MNIPKLYLETTMFSFYHELRTAPLYIEQKALVRRIFELIQASVYRPYTSAYTIEEINKEQQQDKKRKMNTLISDYGITVLADNEEARKLAQSYIREKAIAPVWSTDAAHIAIATYYGLDFIVSLNFKHIVRPWTIERVRQVNTMMNYKVIGIYKPEEVLEIYEDSRGISE